MARRKKKTLNIQPAVKTLYFNVPNGTSWVDLSLTASAINRRFYRQGINWAVSGFTFFNKGAGIGNVTVSKLPDSWTVSNSWEKGFRTWQRMQDQVLDENPSLRTRYRDFKIYADTTHAQSTIQTTASVAGLSNISLMPVSPDGNLILKRGEWEYSTIVMPNDPLSGGATVDYSIHMIGDNMNVATGGNPINSKGLIMGYGFSRSRPQDFDPNIPDADGSQVGEDWMTDVFDLGDQQPALRDDLVDQNDQPPYRVGSSDPTDATNEQIYYVGGDQNLPSLELHDEVGFTSTTVSSKNLMRGNNFPCGLIKIENTVPDDSETSAPIYMQIHLVPGTHKGYLCEPMQDM